MNLPKLPPNDGVPLLLNLPHGVEVLDALFERLLQECRRAVERIHARDYRGKGEAINRALEIVEALDLALDFSVAPELCTQLESLYVYVQECLVMANRHLDATRLASTEKVVLVLRSAFAEAAQACAVRSARPVETPAETPAAPAYVAAGHGPGR